jgi:hypothetical protein
VLLASLNSSPFNLHIMLSKFSGAALAALAAGLVGQSLATPVPIVVHPGNADDIIITSDDTLNGTLAGGSTHKANGADIVNGANNVNGNAQLGLAFQNHFGGAINVYVTGQDTKGDVVFVTSNGQFYYPASTTSSTPVPITDNVAIPVGQGSASSITLPDYLSSGRIWVAAGNLQFFVVDAGGATGLVEPSATNPSDPSAGLNWGFVELTNNDGGIYADISYVDFLGMPLGISLQSADGTQAAKGVAAGAISGVCSALQAQGAADGAPWGDLCVTDTSGNLIRVIAPIDYLSLNPSGFGNYWSSYVSQVWDHYSSNTLSIDTQVGAGVVGCTVSGGVLNCAGDNRGYAQPTAADIFGCNSGPFAIQASDNDVHRAVVPRLCAAFNRSTLLLNGGNLQPGLPASDFYTVSPSNYFSKFVHQFELDGLGYAFSYDDVSATGAPGVAGLVSDGSPQVLTVIIGGP